MANNLSDIFKAPLAFIDLETTGLTPGYHEIIEIGLVLAAPETFEVLDEWETKVSPVHPEYSDKTNRSVNGFNEEDWENAPPAEEALQELQRRVQGSILSGWMTPFEWKFLEIAYSNIGIDINKKGEVFISYHTNDAVPFALKFGRENPNVEELRLHIVARELGIEPEPHPHRAINGARQAFLVHKEFNKMISINKTG